MNDQTCSEFERIVTTLTAVENNVSLGKMMRSLGLKFGDKVFGFQAQAKEGMGFRLGRDFNPNAHFEPLNPLKTKGPLKGLFIVSENQRDGWENLARSVLAFTRTL